MLSAGLPGVHFLGDATAIVSRSSDDFSTHELSPGLYLEPDIRQDALLQDDLYGTLFPLGLRYQLWPGVGLQSRSSCRAAVGLW